MLRIEKELKEHISDIKLKETYLLKGDYKKQIVNLSEVLKEKKPYNLFVVIDINGIEFKIQFFINSDFPFNIPTSKVCNMNVFDGYIDKYKIPPPHISRDGGICISDREDIIVNYKNSEGVLIYSIFHSIKVVSDGYLEKNIKEFLDEFDVHIFNKAQIKTKGLIYLKANLTDINTDRVYISKNKNTYIVTSSSLGEGSKRTLVINLENSINFPLPETNIELFNRLKESNPDILKQYYSYLKRHENTEEVILFSMKNNNAELVFWGVEHKMPKIIGKDTKTGYRFSSSKNDTVTYIPIIDVSQNKIESRLNGLKQMDYPVSIVGCGSIGSLVSEALLELGVRKFNLIDDEIFMPENIVRHIGALKDIGFHKVDVIEAYLLDKKDYIDVKTKKIDVHSILDNSELRQELLNNSNIKFYATGNKSVNNRVLNLINQGKLGGVNLFMWVEPYLYAGHCMIINHPLDLNELYDENNIFKYRVVVDNRNFKRKEAGCGGNYAVYSGFDTKKFIYDILDRIRDLIYSGKIYKHNRILTWTGNLPEARKEGIEISDKYITKIGKNIEEVII